MELQHRADKMAALIEEKLGTRGQGLEAKLARAGRRLPGHVRRELGYVVGALRMQDNPRLARQIDWPRIDAALAAAEHHLRNIDPWERRTTLAIHWLAGNAISLIVVAGLVVLMLAWRGFL